MTSLSIPDEAIHSLRNGVLRQLQEIREAAKSGGVDVFHGAQSQFFCPAQRDMTGHVICGALTR